MRSGTARHRRKPGLICASILGKKLAAGLDALVLDVKTGSGAFLRKPEDSEYLAALLVTTAESAGTRTVALLTDMGQPLGHAAGNWIELAESVELLRGKRPAHSEDLRELSLILAGWMIHLGGQAATPEAGYARAQAALADGSALRSFFAMIEAQGGDTKVFDDPGFHSPGATQVLLAWESGFISTMDTTALGWPSSAPARGAKRPVSRSIPTPESTSMPAVAHASRKASRWPLSTPPRPTYWPSRRQFSSKPSPFRQPHRSGAIGQPHLHPRNCGGSPAQGCKVVR